jgi:two-component system sensor kinase FixL
MRRPWPRRLDRPLRGYALAVLLVALATVLTLKTQPILGEISPFFFLAVMIATWFGGIGPGLLATALAGWASAYYFFDIPAGSGVFGWDDVLRMAVFLSVSLVISSLVNLRRRAERQLRVVNEHLEQRVRERTADLEKSNRLARESEEGFRALVEGVTDCAICLLDPQGRVVQWNTRAEQIQGYREADILGQQFENFYRAHDRTRSRPQDHLAMAARTGRDEEEGWRLRKDGSAFWAHVIITALYNEQSALRGFAHVARDITKLKRLENEILEISEREQRRIGNDLHDGLGQELTGLAFLTQNIRRKLAGRALPEAAEMDRISALINSAIEQTRDLAKGLSPVEWGPDGLVAALRSLAARVRESYGIPCQFDCGRGVLVPSHNAAMNLYRIAQEAVGNAARHGHGTGIWVSIEDDGEEVVLTVQDNGRGIGTAGAQAGGMGLQLMPYRARMIGAVFTIDARPGGGTVIRCRCRKSTESSSGLFSSPEPPSPREPESAKMETPNLQPSLLESRS